MTDSPTFAVVEMRDTPLGDPEAVTMHLLFRVHHDGSQDELFPEKPVTACYDVGYNFRGLVCESSRRDCPAGATPLDPPPIPLREVPNSFDPALQSVLTGLPSTVTENERRWCGVPCRTRSSPVKSHTRRPPWTGREPLLRADARS
ncbi:hypothetical protein [Amycolatopsis tolypomycina]|uniref:hypothetical protein n=1 Tax=Amycolatopsis tolypomycina TaxID=208445 RepID=UPI0033A260E4